MSDPKRTSIEYNFFKKVPIFLCDDNQTVGCIFKEEMEEGDYDHLVYMSTDGTLRNSKGDPAKIAKIKYVLPQSLLISKEDDFENNIDKYDVRIYESLIKRNRTISYFGYAKKGHNISTEQIEFIKNLSDYLVNNYLIMVYGGYYGMSGAITRSVSLKGGYVVGIKCKQVHKETIFHMNDHRKDLMTEDIHDRLRLLFKPNLYIFGEGGPGTLAELSLALDLKRKGNNKKFFVHRSHYDFYKIICDKSQEDVNLINNVFWFNDFEDLEKLLNEERNNKK